jgi:hypothetical protein
MQASIKKTLAEVATDIVGLSTHVDGAAGHGDAATDGRPHRVREMRYSTVTDLARLRGWSTLQPRTTAA